MSNLPADAQHGWPSNPARPSPMICIKIPECTGTEEEMADLLEHIASLIREGFTSGFHPGWELTDVTTTRSA